MNPNEVLYPEKVTYSIPEKISEVLEILKSKNHVNLAMLIYSSDSRTELIATLVAILELCRIGSVLLTGDADNIVITYTASGREQTSPDYLYEEYA
jgi:segregation and condensation protein A